MTAFIVAAASAASAQKETVLADQAAHLKVRLGQMPVDHSAATDLILKITAPDSPWTEARRSDLSHFIFATCRHTTAAAAGPQGSRAPSTPVAPGTPPFGRAAPGTPPVGAPRGSHGQRSLGIMNLTDELLWQILFSTKENINNKLQQFARFMVMRLQMPLPCEKTRQRAVAIAHLCSRLDVAPEIGYSHVHQLAKYCETFAATNGVVAPLAHVYPDAAEEFGILFPHIQLDCVPSKLDGAAIIINSFGCPVVPGVMRS